MGCPYVIAPVCGCDGNTYDNSCLAGANGVNVFAEGRCSAQDQTCPAYMATCDFCGDYADRYYKAPYSVQCNGNGNGGVASCTITRKVKIQVTPGDNNIIKKKVTLYRCKNTNLGGEGSGGEEIAVDTASMLRETGSALRGATN